MCIKGWYGSSRSNLINLQSSTFKTFITQRPLYTASGMQLSTLFLIFPFLSSIAAGLPTDTITNLDPNTNFDIDASDTAFFGFDDDETVSDSAPSNSSSPLIPRWKCDKSWIGSAPPGNSKEEIGCDDRRKGSDKIHDVRPIVYGDGNPSDCKKFNRIGGWRTKIFWGDKNSMCDRIQQTMMVFYDEHCKDTAMVIHRDLVGMDPQGYSCLDHRGDLRPWLSAKASKYW